MNGIAESIGRTARRRPWLEPRQWWLWASGLVGSRYDGLAHFAVVAPGVLMRCGQPRLSDLGEIRDRHGLSSVVCSRGGTRHPLRGRWFRRERAWCQQRGVRLFHLPFSDSAAPQPAVFDRFIEIVGDAAARPVLVHCEQGFHRTGVLCAAYRVAFEGWPLDRAIDEMAALGFEIHRDKRRPLSNALRDWHAARSACVTP
jgi:protein tyrosine/serine phosphatase